MLQKLSFTLLALWLKKKLPCKIHGKYTIWRCPGGIYFLKVNNGICGHNYIKLLLLRAYISSHKFDIICISKTYLNSDTSTVDENLKIAGYTFIRADHPFNSKRGDVCIYYKHSLAFGLLDICYLDECINFEIWFSGKLCNFISLYLSPSQSTGVFEKFADNFELNLDKIANKNSYLIVILGDFNAKSSNWYKYDMTTHEGSKIDAITSQFGLKQFIKNQYIF